MSSTASAADTASVPFNQRSCLSVEQASEYIDLGRTSVFELLKSGQLESLKIGHRRLIVRASVDAFIERRISEVVQ